MNRLFEQDKIRISVYADESMSRECSITNTSWDYMCLCFVSSAEIFNIINCLRFNKGVISVDFQVDCKNEFFKKNNHKIHFNEISSADQFHIAKRFLEWVIDLDSMNHIKFLILGIDRTKIDSSKFGDAKVFENIYNRFFRTALNYGLKRFYNTEDIIIKNIFHETGGQKDHEYFPFHTIWKLKKEFSFECREITFIEKDHIKEVHSNLTQLCDLILGVFTHIIHNEKKDTYKDRLANIALPLVKRAIEESKNKNSSYKHYQRFACSFFPKNGIAKFEGKEVWGSEFYTERPLNYLVSQSSQLSFNL